MKAVEVMAIHTFYEVGMEKYPQECPLGTDWPLAILCDGNGDAGPGTIDVLEGSCYLGRLLLG